MLFADPELTILFASETMQTRHRDGTVIPLDFEGSIISMPGVRPPGGAGHPSMGIAFFSKKTAMKRLAAVQCPRDFWQMLVIETDTLRIIGLYVKPKTPRSEWEALLAKLNHYKAHVRPTVVCGDLNAHHPAWTTGSRDAGGTALLPYVAGDPTTSATPASGTGFVLRAPARPTCTRATARGLSQSTLDLFLIARQADFDIFHPDLLLHEGVGGSDHVPVCVTITAPQQPDTRPRRQFLPTPHRLAKSDLQERAGRTYNSSFPDFKRRIRECANGQDLCDLYLQYEQTVKNPWTMRASQKPARYKNGWTPEIDAVAKERTRLTRRQYSKATTATQKREANAATRRLTKKIQRMLKQERHAEAKDTQRKLAHAASTRQPAEIARLLNRHTRAAREAAQ